MFCLLSFGLARFLWHCIVIYQIDLLLLVHLVESTIAATVALILLLL